MEALRRVMQVWGVLCWFVLAHLLLDWDSVVRGGVREKKNVGWSRGKAGMEKKKVGWSYGTDWRLGRCGRRPARTPGVVDLDSAVSLLWWSGSGSWAGLVLDPWSLYVYFYCFNLFIESGLVSMKIGSRFGLEVCWDLDPCLGYARSFPWSFTLLCFVVSISPVDAGPVGQGVGVYLRTLSALFWWRSIVCLLPFSGRVNFCVLAGFSPLRKLSKNANGVVVCALLAKSYLCESRYRPYVPLLYSILSSIYVC